MAVLLKNRLTGAIHEADLVRDITTADYQALMADWTAYKQQSPISPQDRPQQDSWDWTEKARSTTPEEHFFVGIVLDDVVQGMMMIKRRPVVSRLASAHSVLYIEYLESAPWNLEVYAGKHARYSRVGTSLLIESVRMSFGAGCDGGLGLHSLNTDEAKNFYFAHGFIPVGFDEAEGYFYLELPTADSVAAPYVRK